MNFYLQGVVQLHLVRAHLRNLASWLRVCLWLESKRKFGSCGMFYSLLRRLLSGTLVQQSLLMLLLKLIYVLNFTLVYLAPNLTLSLLFIKQERSIDTDFTQTFLALPGVSLWDISSIKLLNSVILQAKINLLSVVGRLFWTLLVNQVWAGAAVQHLRKISSICLRIVLINGSHILLVIHPISWWHRWFLNWFSSLVLLRILMHASMLIMLIGINIPFKLFLLKILRIITCLLINLMRMQRLFKQKRWLSCNTLTL